MKNQYIMKYTKGFILVLIFLFWSGFLNRVCAEDISTKNNSSMGLSIDQNIFAFDLEVGSSDRFKITVKNIVEHDQEIKVTISDIDIEDNNEIKIIDDESNRGIKNWLKPTKTNFQLNTEKKNEELIFDIKAPENASVGSHYSLITFQSVTNNSEGTVFSKINGGVGAFVLVNIKGEILGPGRINTFNINPAIPAQKSEFDIEFENLGNIHYIPHGTVTIRNIVTGRKEKITLASHFVFPGKKYVYQFNQKLSNQLGLYRITASIVDGDGVEHKVNRYWISFWLFFIIIFLIVLFAFTGFVYKNRIKIREIINLKKGNQE